MFAGNKNKNIEVNEMGKNLKIDNIRKTTDDMTDKLDIQKIDNIKLDIEKENLKSELRHNLSKLDEHSHYPHDVRYHDNIEETIREDIHSVEHVTNHGAGCHCEKCCPNPKPNFFQKNKTPIIFGILWFFILVLAVGWSPSGPLFESIQNSYVDLLVNVFKMTVLGIAALCTYLIAKKKD